MDTKSIASFGDTGSFDSKSMTGSTRSNTKRQIHMLQMKRRQENASLRKLLFRPKVFESWKEGDLDDEIAEKQRLIKDIAAKERKLAERRRLMEQGEGKDSDSGEEENAMLKALDRLKSRKQREEEFEAKLELDRKHVEEDKAIELEDKMQSELQNPSVFGWFYTNGYYDNVPYFGVREDLVPKFAQEQEEWREKWNNKYPETFTQKFKRFFWPPKLLFKDKLFRTRGSYMDFPEVISDWPKFTGTEINFDRDVREYITNRHELFGVDEEQKAEDEKALEEAAILEHQQLLEEGLLPGEAQDGSQQAASEKDKLLGSKHKKPGLSAIEFADKDNWYFDDEEGSFYRKKQGFTNEYYYDNTNHCWRHKKKMLKSGTEPQHMAATSHTRTGFKPNDFVWNNEIKNYVPLSIARKQRGNMITVGDVRPMETTGKYDKPWLLPAKNADGPPPGANPQNFGNINIIAVVDAKPDPRASPRNPDVSKNDDTATDVESIKSGNVTTEGETNPDAIQGNEKPWLAAAPLRNPDTSKTDGKADSQKSGWLNKNNKVAPAKDKRK